MSKELNRQVAGLESKVDHLESELYYINEQLYKCGFPEGIQTLKKTIAELLVESPAEISEDESDLAF